MTTPGPLRFFALGLSIIAIAACGGSPTEQEPAAKVPITTVSPEALASYLEGRKLLEEVRVTDANHRFTASVETDPEFAMGWLMVATTSPTAAEFFAALRNAISNVEGASRGERLQIEAFQASVNGDPEVERTSRQELVAAYPGDERAHCDLGIFLAAQQEYQPAIDAYRAAIAINPDFAQPYNQLGYSLRTVGDYEAAADAFKRYAELIPDQPNPFDSYGELLMKMGYFEDSIATYKKALAVDPTFVASYVGIGNNLVFLGRVNDARSILAQLENVARNDIERRQACTWTSAAFLHANDYDAAFGEIKRRYEIAAQTNDLFAMATDLNLMGDILVYAGRAAEAIEKYETSVDVVRASDATDDVKAAYVRNIAFDLARAALWKGDIATATELASTYREATAEHEIRNELQQSHELTAMLALARGDYEDALFDLAHANQENPRVMLLTGRAFELAGDKEAARQACAQVVDFNEINFNLAFVRNTARDFISNL